MRIKEIADRAKAGEIQVIDSQGNTVTPPSDGSIRAHDLGISRAVVFEVHQVDGYVRPYDDEVKRYKDGTLPLGEMTPSYAYAMTLTELKTACGTVKSFDGEMALARLWRDKLQLLASAYNLSADHFNIDTSGPVLHVHPLEESGVTLGANGLPLDFAFFREEDRREPSEVGRGFEAFLPTHVQKSGYMTAAHPEMDASMSASEAFPTIQIGSYVRIGGALNPQGNSAWKLNDYCWLGQNCYFISQEHDATVPSVLARSRQHSNFPGCEVGSWAWVCKNAQILYRTQYIGKGAVVGASEKINTWVSDYSLATGDGHVTFYPLKAFAIETLGINDIQGMLSLDWKLVEKRFMSEYEALKRTESEPDRNVAEAIRAVRKKPRARVLFIGSENQANVIFAASKAGGENVLRRIDVMSLDQSQTAFTMQALNGMHNLNTRFRKIESLTDVPIGKFYEEPAYDLVVVETSAENCCGEHRAFRGACAEAQRLVAPDGKIVGTLNNASEFAGAITLPQYVTIDESMRSTSDRMAVHIQNTAIRNGS